MFDSNLVKELSPPPRGSYVVQSEQMRFYSGTHVGTLRNAVSLLGAIGTVRMETWKY